jgi:lipopolysaccharide/colanic/teichoic acid biosynthesis glycosyltransferase
MRRKRYYRFVEDIIWVAQQGVEIWDAATAYERLEKRIPLRYVDEIWLLFAATNWPRIHVRRLKRVIDIFVSGSGLVISFPIMVITALAIWLGDRGPVLLCQNRIGKNGRIIHIYKIRTMYQCEPEPGDKGTRINDRRITPVGRWVRMLHIDELPQLFNVFRGDLSMVGPRAEIFDFVREYMGCSLEEGYAGDTHAFPKAEEKINDIALAGYQGDAAENLTEIIPYIDQRFTISQGITGWAQVMRPYVTSSYADMVEKLEYDLYYIKNMSFFLDLIILLKTLRVVFLGKGK